MVSNEQTPAARDSAIAALSKRSRDVLRRVIEQYMETGEPIGSRTISRLEGVGLSPASIRNVMSDLEEIGLLFAPHASAGRLPTDLGMRLFVDGLLEVGRLTEQERADIEKQKGALSQEALQRRAEKWQREMMALQQVFVEYNKDLQKKQNELTQPIFTKAMGLIRRLATQEGFDVIIDKQAVPYVRSDLDVTDRVITMYNGGAPPAAAKEGAPKQEAPKLGAPTAPTLDVPGVPRP